MDLSYIINKIKNSSKISFRKRKLRRTDIYKQWRKAVYSRDNFRCQVCGRKGYLNAHHLKSFWKYKNIRHSVDNGLTLCYWCHSKFHKKYGKSDFPDIKKLIHEGKLDLN